MRFSQFVALLILLSPAAALAERITYELYDVASGAKPTLISKGIREYSVKDVIVDEHLVASGPMWSKEIPIADGFHAGAVIYRKKELTGFALQLKRREGLMGAISQGGFSWDWFDRESGLNFRKLQGGGRVKVTLVPSTEFQEIAAVEVLEDITLRVIGRPWWFFSQDDTHHLLIRHGSVLRFAP